MDKADFDRHARNYTETLDSCIRVSGYASSDFAERKVREMHMYMKALGLADGNLRVLDFGCGIGVSEPYLRCYFPGADIFALDVSRESIELARERNRDLDRVTFSVFDGVHIPFPGPFDLIMIAGVLHHIDSVMRINILSAIKDILSPEGKLFIFEHNPWNPVTRRIVHDCAFDENADLVSPLAAADLLKRSGFMMRTLRFIHFFPRLLDFLTPLERYLRKMPLGAQYYYIAGKRNS